MSEIDADQRNLWVHRPTEDSIAQMMITNVEKDRHNFLVSFCNGSLAESRRVLVMGSSMDPRSRSSVLRSFLVHRWIDDHCETIRIKLDESLTVSEIQGVKLEIADDDDSPPPLSQAIS